MARIFRPEPKPRPPKPNDKRRQRLVYADPRWRPLREQVLATYRPGDDFAQCWRRAYNAVIAREKYDVKRRKEVPYGAHI